MVDATQTASTLLTHQLLTNAATAAGLSVVGSEVDVRTWLAARVYIYHAFVQEGQANDPGLDYHFQARWPTGASVDEDWITLWTFTAGTLTVANATISGDEGAESTTIGVDSDATGVFLPGTKIYIQDTGTLADSEWARVAISATSPDIITLVDGLTTAKDASDIIWSDAETFTGTLSLSEISYVRMIVQNADTSGANFHFKAHMISMTDFE